MESEGEGMQFSLMILYRELDLNHQLSYFLITSLDLRVIESGELSDLVILKRDCLASLCWQLLQGGGIRKVL